MLKYISVICLLSLLIYFTQTNFADSQTIFNPNSYTGDHDNVLIILDASYSMEDSLNGQRKIDIAKRAINQVLSELSPNVWVGLRVYGHKSGFLGYKSCRASELKVSIGADNQSLISQELAKIEPVGWTPISYSIQQAVNNDFRGLSGKKRIILVSDGMETCDGSPCDYVVGLIKNGIDLKIDTIGFNLSDKMAVSQLKCTALATRGKFYTANNAQELADSLAKTLNTSKEVQGKIITK